MGSEREELHPSDIQDREAWLSLWQLTVTSPGPAPTCGSVRIHLLWLMSITWRSFHLHVHPFPAMHVDLYADRQWIRRAGQADLARLRAPWDPVAGRYRTPDEKTIRVVLDRLDPRALARALLGCPDGRRRPGGRPPASVRGYRARRAARQAQELARGRLRAVAVDGKTCRGARRPDGTRVHLLGVAEHGGHLLDHLEVDVKHNETSHFTELLGPVNLDGAVVTFDALCRRRHKASYEDPVVMPMPPSGAVSVVAAGRMSPVTRNEDVGARLRR